MRPYLTAITGAALSLAIIATAHAETLDFTLQGGIFTAGPATFSLNSNPEPSQYNESGFGINNVPLTYDDVITSYNLGFSNSAMSESSFFEYARSGNADFATGPALFTGSTSAPQFKVGDFTFADAEAGTPLLVDISPVPEPSTWVLMIAGIGGIGLMLRRARKTMGFRFKDVFAA